MDPCALRSRWGWTEGGLRGWAVPSSNVPGGEEVQRVSLKQLEGDYNAGQRETTHGKMRSGTIVHGTEGAPRET